MIKKSVFPVAIAILAVLGIIFIIDSLKDVSENFSSNGTDIRGARQWEYMRLRDPKTGLIPKNIHSVELQFVSSLPGSYKNISNSKYASLLSNKWDMRGPSNIGGRSRDIAKDILDKNTINAGGVAGGMWRSIDDGQTWKNTTRPDQLHSSTSIAQDRRTGKENIWYYGTGELRGSSAQSSGDGIFKSLLIMLNSWKPGHGSLLNSIVRPMIAKVYIDDYKGPRKKASKIVGIDGSRGSVSTLDKLYIEYKNIKTIIPE